MTPETETAIIAAAVTTCHAEREVTIPGRDVNATLVCGLAQGHDGIVHWDSADCTFWAVAQPGMTRDQAAAIAGRLAAAL